MIDQEHLKQWFKDHPFISVSAVSKEVGWSRLVLNEKLSGHRKPLNEQEMAKVTHLLKKYGYTEK
jgi:hypothetical protein